MLDDMVLFFTIWINFCSIFLAHPVFFSMTNMDIDSQKGDIVLSIRIFTDDLETILHNRYNVDGWIGTPKEHRDSRRLLSEYIHERFSVAVNKGKKLDLQTDSITIVEDSMWFYMKSAAQQTIRHVEIDNRLLTDFFSNQTNLVIISANQNETGLMHRIKYWFTGVSKDVDSKEYGYKLNRKIHKIELSL